MRKLYLIFHGRFPSEKAAALFTAKNAESFARLGTLDVHVLVPRRNILLTEDAYDYFGVDKIFKISTLQILNLFDFNLLGFRFSRKVAFWLNFLSFSFSCFYFINKHARQDDIVYSNESLPLFFLSFINKNTFYEMHDFPESKLTLFSYFLKRVRWVLAHNKWKSNRLGEMFGIDQDKIICEPNAVDIEEFDISINMEDARIKFEFPLDKKIVMYTGHLYGWKGVDVLAQTATILSKEYLTVFVGGTAEDIERFKRNYSTNSNIKIVGFRPHSEISFWQKTADVLVLPNTAKENISKYYTSPMKLFEYAASGRPIVASRIPSIVELVNEKQVYLVEPDNPKALAEGIRSVCEDKAMASSLANEAYVWAKEHTWSKRAERILRFMAEN